MTTTKRWASLTTLADEAGRLAGRDDVPPRWIPWYERTLPLDDGAVLALVEARLVDVDGRTLRDDEKPAARKWFRVGYYYQQDLAVPE